MNATYDEKKGLMQCTALGLMSGTSLDGLDVCHAEFRWKKNSRTKDPRDMSPWSFRMLNSKTFEHPPKLRMKVSQAHLLPKEEILILGEEYADWVTDCIKTFLPEQFLFNDIEVIGFHGPTLFHDVASQNSYQLGDAQRISNSLGCDVVADFRNADLKMGGRGAPLVPTGDSLLFDEYQARVNLGGFANFSVSDGSILTSSDSSICNYAMDRLAQKMGAEFDKNGDLARKGEIDLGLLEFLNSEMNRFQNGVALTREWAEERILESLISSDPSNALTTLCEHIAIQLSKQIGSAKSAILTGGGARNGYLVERIKSHLFAEVIIPEKDIIDMKEALIFGLLAVLKKRDLYNVFAATTGSSQDHTTGELFVSQG